MALAQPLSHCTNSSKSWLRNQYYVACCRENNYCRLPDLGVLSCCIWSLIYILHADLRFCETETTHRIYVQNRGWIQNKSKSDKLVLWTFGELWNQQVRMEASYGRRDTSTMLMSALSGWYKSTPNRRTNLRRKFTRLKKVGSVLPALRVHCSYNVSNKF